MDIFLQDPLGLLWATHQPFLCHQVIRIMSYHLQEISLIWVHIFSFLHNWKKLIFLPT